MKPKNNTQNLPLSLQQAELLKRKTVTLHPKQFEAFSDPARFKYICAGRRGGKTKLIIESIAKSIYLCPDNCDAVYIGPTNQQAVELIWEALIERFDELKWRNYPLISKQKINFSRGRRVFVIGAEKIRRIRGHRVWHGFLDEVAYFGPSLKFVWNALRPALADVKGSATFATTPSGKDTDAFNFWMEAKTKPDWKTFEWTSLQNPFLDPLEIDAARAELDEKSFRQEFEATWESFEGLAYYSFQEKTHVALCPGIDPAHAIDLTLDFNVNPTSLLVCQFINGLVSIKKEYSIKNSSTIETVQKFVTDFKHLSDKAYFRVFGDASGNSRSSTTGMSDYFYLREIFTSENFKYDLCIPAANPSIIDRVQYTNSWLKPLAGLPKVQIDPSCTDLITDLSCQEVLGRIPTAKNNLGHKADALGYYICYLQNSLKRKKQGTVFL